MTSIIKTCSFKSNLRGTFKSWCLMQRIKFLHVLKDRLTFASSTILPGLRSFTLPCSMKNPYILTLVLLYILSRTLIPQGNSLYSDSWLLCALISSEFLLPLRPSFPIISHRIVEIEAHCTVIKLFCIDIFITLVVMTWVLFRFTVILASQGCTKIEVWGLLSAPG